MRATYLMDAAYGNLSGVPVTEIDEVKVEGVLEEAPYSSLYHLRLC